MVRTKTRGILVVLLACVMTFALCLGLSFAPKHAVAAEATSIKVGTVDFTTATSSPGSNKFGNHEGFYYAMQGNTCTATAGKGIEIKYSDYKFAIVFNTDETVKVSFGFYSTKNDDARTLNPILKSLTQQQFEDAASEAAHSELFSATVSSTNVKEYGTISLKKEVEQSLEAVTVEAGSYILFPRSSGNNVYLKSATVESAALAQEQEYTVHYNANGGTVESGETVDKTITYQAGDVPGSKQAEQLVPTQAGYKFLGWYESDAQWSDTEKQYDFSSGVTSDLYLKAKWEKLVCVTYLLNGGTYNGAEIPNAVQEDGKIIIPVDEETSLAHEIKKEDLTYAGMDFHGWHLAGDDNTSDSGTHFDFSLAVNTDITLVAVWHTTDATKKVVKVDHFTNNDENDPTKLTYDQTLEYGIPDMTMTRADIRQAIINELLSKVELRGHTATENNSPEEVIKTTLWENIEKGDSVGEEIKDTDTADKVLGKTLTYVCQLNNAIALSNDSSYYTDLWLEVQVKVVDGRTLINKIDVPDTEVVYPQEVADFALPQTVTANDTMVQNLSVTWEEIDRRMGGEQVVHGTVTIDDNTMVWGQDVPHSVDVTIRLIVAETEQVVKVWSLPEYGTSWVYDLTKDVNKKETMDTLETITLYEQGGLKVVANAYVDESTFTSGGHKHTAGFIKLNNVQTNPKDTEESKKHPENTNLKITVPEGYTATFIFGVSAYGSGNTVTLNVSGSDISDITEPNHTTKGTGTTGSSLTSAIIIILLKRLLLKT